MKYSLDRIETLDIPIYLGDTIFFYGDLGAGKTTLIRNLLKKYLPPHGVVRSPTYTHVQKYEISPKIEESGLLGENGLPTTISWYHFDLYRIDDYETFISIGGEEMFADISSIRCVEWPEKLCDTYTPSLSIHLFPTTDPEIRELTIERHFIPEN